MMVADDDVPAQQVVHENDIDKTGYLQKKTSKGLWASRFFATDTRYLRYWHDRSQYDKGQPASEVFDLAEVSGVEKFDLKVCKIMFLKNTKFQLVFRGETEAEMTEWVEIIRAKIKLYSVDELLADLTGERVSFRTKTFRVLLLLSEKEQNNWILNRLDEAFETSNDDHHIKQLRSSPAHLLRATCRAFNEFLELCLDCRQEMTSRSPRIIAHSSNYMHRYADILKGRTMLELLYIPGIENKKFEMMGEQALCIALELAQKLEALREYLFIPKTLVSTLTSSLFSFGDLLSALLNLSLRRVDAYFEVLSALPPELHAKKLGDATCLIAEFAQLVKEDLSTSYLFGLVMDKAITTLLLAFNDHFLSWDTNSYSETHFISHIQACDTLQSTLQRTCVDLTQRKVIVLDTAPPSGADADPQHLRISAAVQDAVRCTCVHSAHAAVKQSVDRLQDSKAYLVQGLLDEHSMLWLTGALMASLVNNLDQWASFICAALPARFTFMVYLHVSRVLIKMYVAHMIDRHKAKQRGVATERGVRQVAQDLMAIKSWISTYESSIDAVTEQHLIVVLQSFLLCSQKDMVHAFSEAMLLFGINYALHAYDLLRLALKYRPDVNDVDRKAILGLCAEFIVQIRRAMESDSFSFALPTQDMAILDELLPRVGVEHCTGRKWKMSTLPDSRTVNVALSVIVTEICDKAMAARRMTDGRTAYQSRVKAEPLKLSLPPPQSGAEKPWGESSEASAAASAPSEGDCSSSVRLGGSQRRPPPPPPPRRRATVAGTGNPTESPAITAPTAPTSVTEQIFGAASAEQMEAADGVPSEPSLPVPQLPDETVQVEAPMDPAHAQRALRVLSSTPPPPPPLRSKSPIPVSSQPVRVEDTSAHSSNENSALEASRDGSPSSKLIAPPPSRQVSLAPPPKPARRASTSAIPTATTIIPAQSRILTAQEALHVMLETAKKSVATTTS